MKINPQLLPMKLHYFLIFGGTAPLLPYLPVYINQNLHISYKGIALIYTILPFFGLLAKTLLGAVADWFKLYRTIFLSSIVISAVCFFSICFVNPIPYEHALKPGHLQFDCSSPLSYLRHTLEDKKCWRKLKRNGTTTCELQCEAEPETVKKLCKSWNISVIDCPEEVLAFSSFSHINHVVEQGNELFIPLSNLTYVGNKVTAPTCEHHIRTNCCVTCDNEQLMTYMGMPTKTYISSYSEFLSQHNFWIFLVLIIMAWSALAICSVMSDTICFQLLGSEGNRYGRQRLWGSMGWGCLVIFTGFLIDYVSGDSFRKNYLPAFILSIAVFSVDFLVATRLQVKSQMRERSKVSDVLRLLSSPRVVVFIISCFVVGLCTGTLWTYQLILVEETVYAWDCHFAHLTLLQGLIVGVSCFGGEIPCFFFSEHLINKLGHTHCMSLVSAVFGLRFILYAGVANPWLFLPIELLNGLTFGIFYAIMTSYANIMAPPGAEATMQGIMGATFEGLGVASGGLVGGCLFSSVGGARAFLYVGCLSAGYALIHVATQALFDKFLPQLTTDAPHLNGYLPPDEHLNHEDADDNDLHREHPPSR